MTFPINAQEMTGSVQIGQLLCKRGKIMVAEVLRPYARVLMGGS